MMRMRQDNDDDIMMLKTESKVGLVSRFEVRMHQ